ncbi:16378_t:CDS:2 [Funneliformis caledonium]|uniref:16378_t:CDS:1 n=1 Tax=Funneliformis caledonium TaxID=1117310 RepID=A0A9N9DIM7_9GLOM|nr:16378_t:CDS:2 [Funneliformis caledonium]
MEYLSLNYATLSNVLSAYPTIQDDKLEQVLDDYKKEELNEIEAYMADSQKEYEEKADLLPLNYNP